MKNSKKRRSSKAGLPPGTLVHIGEKKTEKIVLSLMDYSEGRLEEKILEKPEDLCAYLKKQSTVTWVNVYGIHDVKTIEKLGEILGVHILVLEDVMNSRQRPKAESYDDHLFIVLKMIRYDLESSGLNVEQVSFILGKNYVLTFQEREGDVFDPIRDRIRNSKGRIRKAGADYLAYALIDIVVDHYFLALEGVGDELEGMEDVLIANPRTETLAAIHDKKRVMASLRKAVWPLRELVLALERSESGLIAKETEPFLRDVYDHIVQIIDMMETQRDTLSGFLDIYLSSVSNRMNEVMKVLTIIATIFIPLTFIAGIYGMNFEYMPELKWRWAYPAVWGAMIGLGLGMGAYFRKKRWL